MKRHQFRSSITDYLLIADSQTTDLDFPHTNILSISGGTINDIYYFAPQKGQFKVIILFVGGNDLFDKSGKRKPISASDLASKLASLAQALSNLCTQVFVIGIPPRHYRPEESIAVNEALQQISGDWIFRGLSHYIYKSSKDKNSHTREDRVHLTKKALSSLKSIIKLKIIRHRYNDKANIVGHPITINCDTKCKCNFFNQS